MRYDGTFNDYVNECMQSVFDGLVSGGMKGMKAALYNCISNAAYISKNGGWKQ